MSNTKYGNVSSLQIHSAKLYLQKRIFYLLLYLDPKECIKFKDVDINCAFKTVQLQLLGFNKILLEPPELLIVMSVLESALLLYNSNDYNWHTYRKLILDAGSKIMEVKEGGCNASHS